MLVLGPRVLLLLGRSSKQKRLQSRADSSEEPAADQQPRARPQVQLKGKRGTQKERGASEVAQPNEAKQGDT